MSKPDTIDPLLAEQIAYYRALAPEYQSRHIPGWGGPEVVAALNAFRPIGDVLELACGPAMWTDLLLRSWLRSVGGSPSPRRQGPSSTV